MKRIKTVNPLDEALKELSAPPVLNRGLDKYGAVFRSRWTKASHDNITLLGRWAEDDSPYEVVVPPQLRDLIQEMQNSLYDLYYTVGATQEAARHARQAFPLKGD